MKSTLVFLCLWLGMVKIGICQWQTLGKFNYPPSCVWYDSTVNRIYVAGGYTYFDSSQVVGFGFIQGDSIASLGCGFDYQCNTNLSYNAGLRKVTSFARFQGNLYVTGFFFMAGGHLSPGIAVWDGNDWQPIGRGLRYDDDSFANGHKLKVINNELFLFGFFDSIAGVAANGMAKFDGNQWSDVFNFPKIDNNGLGPNRVIDGCWYQGEFYVGGYFQNDSLNTLVKWNGNYWAPVDEGFIGFTPGVSNLLIYQGKLVVSGHFNKWQNPGSIPGNGITAWDGSKWDTLNGGLYYRAPAGTADYVRIWGNELLVGGGFDGMGSVPAKNLAMWNGQRWCGLWDNNDYWVRDIYVVRDTLYMAYASGSPSGVAPNYWFARWLGGPFHNNCEPVAIEDPQESLQVSLYPNPAQDFIQIALPDGQNIASLTLFDPMGRKVMEIPDYEGEKVAVGNLAAGLYFAELEVGNRKAVVRWVKE